CPAVALTKAGCQLPVAGLPRRSLGEGGLPVARCPLPGARGQGRARGSAVTADILDVSTRRQRVVTADQWGKPDRNADGEPICRWCRGPAVAPRRTCCGDTCVHEW